MIGRVRGKSSLQAGETRAGKSYDMKWYPLYQQRHMKAQAINSLATELIKKNSETYGIIHVATINGHSRFTVGHTTMPSKII